MQILTQLFNERTILGNLLGSGFLVVSVVLLRIVALRFVRRTKWVDEQIQIRWTVYIRWLSLLQLLVGLVIIWGSELRTLALSVVAIAAAVVLATKELILCVSGAVLRATSGSFSIGDRIELANIRGDVVDMGILTTTILEIGPGHRRTGRAVVIPNSIFLTVQVTNETFTDEFVLHLIVVPLDSLMDWISAEQRLLTAASEVCEPIMARARQYMDMAAQRHNLPSFSVEPTVNIQIPEAGKINLLLRVPSRAQEKGYTEQQILRRFLNPLSNQESKQTPNELRMNSQFAQSRR